MNLYNIFDVINKWYYLAILSIDCVIILKLFDSYYGFPRKKISEHISFFINILKDGLFLAVLLLIGEFCVMSILAK